MSIEYSELLAMMQRGIHPKDVLPVGDPSVLPEAQDQQVDDVEKVAVGELVSNAGEPEVLSTQDVAKIFRVDQKTVSRWVASGEFENRNVQVLTTFGGHRRFYKEEIFQLYELMLEGKLYHEDERGNIDKTAAPSRIAGLPAAATGDARLS